MNDTDSLLLKSKIEKTVKLLRQATKDMPHTMISQIIDVYGKDPYLILISCLLSLRTRDTLTLPVSLKLFSIARTPFEMLSISVPQLEKVIYPVGFYKKKSILLHEVSQDLIIRFNGKVPSTESDLLSIKGVGIKTANLVLGEAFGVPAICVDTHVHRISNFMGIVHTNTPEQTEVALKKIIPKKYCIEWGRLLVMWGQNVRSLKSPFLSNKQIFNEAKRLGLLNSFMRKKKGHH